MALAIAAGTASAQERSTPAVPPPSTAATSSPTAAARKAQLAEAAASGGDLRGSLFAWQEAVNLDPGNAGYRMKLGEAYERLTFWDEAAREYDLAAALDPPGAEAARRGERARALRDGKPVPAQARDRASTPAAAPYEAGVALIASGRYGEALASLDEAVRRDPKLPVAYTARASALFGLARYADAAADYRTALALDFAQATPLFGLGECYRLLGQGATAADHYARYLESSAPDAREDLRAEARRRLGELRKAPQP